MIRTQVARKDRVRTSSSVVEAMGHPGTPAKRRSGSSGSSMPPILPSAQAGRRSRVSAPTPNRSASKPWGAQPGSSPAIVSPRAGPGPVSSRSRTGRRSSAWRPGCSRPAGRWTRQPLSANAGLAWPPYLQCHSERGSSERAGRRALSPGSLCMTNGCPDRGSDQGVFDWPRPGDSIYRFGGEEYLVLAVELDMAHATDLANRLLSNTGRASISRDNGRRTSDEPAATWGRRPRSADMLTPTDPSTAD